MTTPGLFERTGSVRAAAVLRIALGPITLLHLAPFLRDARRSIAYDDHFWKPFLPWLPHPSGDVWFVLLWIGAAAAAFMTVGLFTRAASVTTFAVVAGNLLLSQTHFRHNRAFLAILLLGVALLPAGRVLSLDARRGRARTDQSWIWPLYLLRVQVSLVYLASGLSKLVDPDWLGGLVLWDRVVRYQHVLDPWPVPGWAVDLLTSRGLYYAVAPAAVLTELAIGLGLWRRRSRLAAVWLAIVFHLAIEVSASVEVFSYAAIAALAIWVTPSARDRTLRMRTGTRGARALRMASRLGDWFGRFRYEEGGAEEPAIVVVDRDGTVLVGAPAVLFVLTRLPLTFPFAAPVAALASRSRSRGGRDQLAEASSMPYFTKRL